MYTWFDLFTSKNHLFMQLTLQVELEYERYVSSNKRLTFSAMQWKTGTCETNILRGFLAASNVIA
jgi:hypothetical protein